MVKVDTTGINLLSMQIGNLYLSEEFSDVKIVIGKVEISAHRMVLAQRCPYFKAMFTSGFSESTSKSIELHETPLNGFKSVLKWIYTGVIEFTEINTALETLNLAHMYELLDLEDSTVNYLKTVCNADNVHLILDSINLSVTELSDFMTKFVKDNIFGIMDHETFEVFSVSALDFVLSKAMYVHKTEVLKSFVTWMRANTHKSAHFRKLLKRIPLYLINFGELIFIMPSDLFSANMLADVVREQQHMSEIGLIGVDVIQPGITFITGGNKFVFDSFSNDSLGHAVSDSRGIVFDLGQRFRLNRLCLDTHAKGSHSYEVCISVDNIHWAIVANHLSHDSTDLGHVFHFNERLVRFIRVCGMAPYDDTFELYDLEACYVI